MSPVSLNGAADQTFSQIQLKIVAILKDPFLGAEVPESTKNATYQIMNKINSFGSISAYCSNIAATSNLQFLEQKIFNTVEESRIDYLFVHKPIGVVPLTGVVYNNIVSSITWNSELEAPTFGTNLPSSSLIVKLSFYADAEGWSLSNIEPLML